MTQTLIVDDLRFEIRRSSRRRTVGITVERDGSLFISAPPGCSLADLERVARARQVWVYTRLAEKEMLLGPEQQEQQREFVNGEGFYYLGRSYRLLIVEPEDAGSPLRLQHGRFKLRRDALAQARRHFTDWYAAHGRPWLQDRVDLYAPRIGVAPGPVVIRDLGYRWGSCSKNGQLNFHWRAVCLPVWIIDYIIVHELVHLRQPHHNQVFWERLGRVLPDFAERRRWLAANGRRY